MKAKAKVRVVSWGEEVSRRESVLGVGSRGLEVVLEMGTGKGDMKREPNVGFSHWKKKKEEKKRDHSHSEAGSN